MDLEVLLQEYLSVDSTTDSQAKAFDEIASLIHEESGDNKCSFQDLIELLERYLTSSDEKERNKATTLLADLLHVKRFPLRPPVIHLFVVFFCRRLSDYPSTSPSLHALTALVRHHGGKLDTKYFDAVDIFQSVFKDVNVPTYPQNVRQKVFTLFDELLSQQPIVESLQTIGLEVVEGVLASMEHEKDPRCLLQALQLVGKVIVSFSTFVTGNLAEKVFDATSCYFPITFTPPPDDPFGITPEALTSALDSCLCVHKNIVPHSVQFFVNQLVSDLPAARMHAMNSLSLVVSAHSHTVLRTDQTYATAGPIHDSLLSACSEYLYDMATDDTASQYISRSLTTINAITGSIGRDISGKYVEDWRQFCEPMLKRVSGEVHGNLGGIQAKMAVEVAFSIAKAGCMCCCAVTNLLAPLLVNKAADTRNVLHSSLGRSLLAEKKGFSVLPAISGSESVLSTSVEMLSKLISCSLKLSSGSGDVTSSVDFSQMLALDPLKAHAALLFDVLSSFLQTDDVSVSDESAVAVNFERLLAFQPTLDKIAVVVGAGKAMKELLVRVSIAELDSSKLAQYIHLLTGLALHGLPYLWLHEAFDADNELLLAEVQRNDRANRVISEDPIKSVFLEVVVSLASNKELDALLRTHCVGKLLRSLEHSGNPMVTVNIYSTLSSLAREAKGDSLISTFLPSLYASISTNVAAVEEKLTGCNDTVGANIKVLTQAIATVSDLLQSEPRAAPAVSAPAAHTHSHNGQECTSSHSHDEDSDANATGATTVVDNEAKAKYLSRSLSADQHTNAQHIIANITLLCEKCLAAESVAVETDLLIEALFTFVRRLVCALRAAEQTEFVEDMLRLLVTSEDSRSLLLSAVAANLLVYLDKSSTLFTQAKSVSSEASDPVLESFDESHLLCARMALNHLRATGEKVLREGTWEEEFGSAQLLGIIINKLPNGGALQYVLSEVLAMYAAHQTSLRGDSTSFSHEKSALFASTFIYCLKGVYMRPMVRNTSSRFPDSASWQDAYLSNLVHTMTDSEDRTGCSAHLRDLVATQLSSLVVDHAHVLSATSHVNCTLFWKQKLWSALFPALLADANKFIASTSVEKVSGDVSGAAVRNSSSVLAICTLTVGLPVSITHDSHKELVDIAVYALSYSHEAPAKGSRSTPLQKQSIKTLEILLRDNAAEFVSYLNIIVPVILKVTQSAYEAKQRATAVECLIVLAQQMPYPRVHPFKTAIVDGLRAVLNDKKRVVRQLAGKARNKWMTLN